MILYNLINPSDPYTFEAPDFEAAFLTVQVIFGTQYGAEVLHGGTDEDRVPVFILRSLNEFIRERFGVSRDEFEASIPEKWDRLPPVLDTFCCGSREGFDALTIEERAARNDQRRTSLNDIGRRAFEAAARIRDVRAGQVAK